MSRASSRARSLDCGTPCNKPALAQRRWSPTCSVKRGSGLHGPQGRHHGRAGRGHQRLSDAHRQRHLHSDLRSAACRTLGDGEPGDAPADAEEPAGHHRRRRQPALRHPALLSSYKACKLTSDDMITRQYTLEQINQSHRTCWTATTFAASSTARTTIGSSYAADTPTSVILRCARPSFAAPTTSHGHPVTACRSRASPGAREPARRRPPRERSRRRRDGHGAPARGDIRRSDKSTVLPARRRTAAPWALVIASSQPITGNARLLCSLA
jgi:hypothetical protein